MRKSMRLAAIFGLIAAAAGPPAPAEQRVVGWVEMVKLGTEGLAIAAKLDTGADSSSVHAEGLRWFVRDEGDWVGFDVTNERGEKVRFERKVLRTVRIRRATGESQRRPIIMLGICLGNVYRVTQVNLVDRGQLNYEVLIGRRFLHGHFAVDSARTHTVEPSCDASRPQ